MFLGCLKWAAVGFIVAFALMKLFEASHIHDDIPKPAFKIRQTKRATFVLSGRTGAFDPSLHGVKVPTFDGHLNQSNTG